VGAACRTRPRAQTTPTGTRGATESCGEAGELLAAALNITATREQLEHVMAARVPVIVVGQAPALQIVAIVGQATAVEHATAVGTPQGRGCRRVARG
jgi:hypothetical protein